MARFSRTEAEVVALAEASVYFSTDYLCYDWVDDDGYNNMGNPKLANF